MTNPSPSGADAPPPRAATSRLALIAFVLIMAALMAIGLFSRSRRPGPAATAPEGAEVQAARDSLAGGLNITTVDLRFEESLTSGLQIPRLFSLNRRIEAAERLLVAAQKSAPRNARLASWRGHLELARHRYERAERHYRTAVDLAPRDGEARLGLGVTLAMIARTEGDASRGRSHLLEAIAQFASVPETDSAFYLPALYNRVVLLAQVDRRDEARRWADRYRELEPGSSWSVVLTRMFEEPN